jgi:hypothetical protein
MVQELEI